MTDATYRLDETSYDARYKQVLQQAENVLKKKATPNLSLEEIKKLEKEYANIKDQIDNLINDLEVESFLTNGPLGKDPI